MSLGIAGTMHVYYLQLMRLMWDMSIRAAT